MEWYYTASSMGGLYMMIKFDSLAPQPERPGAAAQMNDTNDTLPFLSNLAAHVLKMWRSAKEAKERHIERRMIQALRDMRGEYDPEKEAILKREGCKTTIFCRLTAEKASAAIALISDILFQEGVHLCSVQETPIPELSEQHRAKIESVVMQKATTDLKQKLAMLVQAGDITEPRQAKDWMLTEMQALSDEIAQTIKVKMQEAASEASKVAEDKLYDVLLETGWEDAIRDVIEDAVIFPAGILKGPVLRQKKNIIWEGNVPSVREEVSIDFNSPSPFDIYPLPSSQRPEDGLIERHRLTREYLTSLIGVAGYNEDAIRQVLSESRASTSGWLSVINDTVRQSLEDRPTEQFNSSDERIDALQYWGNISGALLLSYGYEFEPDMIDPVRSYPCEIWLVNRHVIKAAINQDILGRVPYSFVSFRRQKGSLWGSASIADLCRDAQDTCNSACRSIIHNMALSSGPQIVYDISQLPDGINLSEIAPFKIWTFSSDKGPGANSTRKPIDFFVVPSVVSELMNVYQFFSNEADNKTGIPKYSYGSQGGGTGAINTATGMSMMLNNSLKSIKQVIRNIDRYIIRPSVQRTYEMLLFQFNTPEIQSGDIKLKAVGASALIAKEVVQLRRNELFQVLATNPNLLNLVGEEILAKVFIAVFRGADIPFESVVEDRLKEHIKQQLISAQQAQQPQQQQQIQQQQSQVKPPQHSNDAGHRHGGKDFQTV
jgi:hypothetical protein